MWEKILDVPFFISLSSEPSNRLNEQDLQPFYIRQHVYVRNCIPSEQVRALGLRRGLRIGRLIRKGGRSIINTRSRHVGDCE